jgi:hypothetical protein
VARRFTLLDEPYYEALVRVVDHLGEQDVARLLGDREDALASLDDIGRALSEEE